MECRVVRIPYKGSTGITHNQDSRTSFRWIGNYDKNDLSKEVTPLGMTNYGNGLKHVSNARRQVGDVSTDCELSSTQP